MKLWHSLSLNTCWMVLLLLSAAAGHGSAAGTRGARGVEEVEEVEESPLELPSLSLRLAVSSPGRGSSSGHRREGRSTWTGHTTDTEQQEEELEPGDKYVMEESLSDDYDDVVDLIKVTISRVRHSPASASTRPRTRHRRAKKRAPSQPRRGAPGRRVSGGQGRGQGCVLRQIQLNITDLGLGYRSGEEMIFRYCAGPCRKSETNYDKILSNLAHKKRLPPKERPAQACCRPVAFDDDLSFLDDNLVYHTVRKHSARKCACV